MRLFRKRLSLEMKAQINQLIIDGGKHKPDDADPGSRGRAEETKADTPTEPDNRGTLIVAATCAPADNNFPTDDVSLLSEARKKLEGIIDTALRYEKSEYSGLSRQGIRSK